MESQYSKIMELMISPEQKAAIEKLTKKLGEVRFAQSKPSARSTMVTGIIIIVLLLIAGFIFAKYSLFAAGFNYQVILIIIFVAIASMSANHYLDKFFKQRYAPEIEAKKGELVQLLKSDPGLSQIYRACSIIYHEEGNFSGNVDSALYDTLIKLIQ